MFNGLLASYILSSEKLIFYILSSTAFVGLLSMVLKGEDNHGFKSLKQFVLIGWTLFPVVFLFAPTGFGVLNTATSESGYLLLDFANKIVFGVFTSKLK
jgi:sensory rhodopsin